MFQLLNGVDQFVRTGNAKLLFGCYEKETVQDIGKLIQKLMEFSNIINLCDIKKIDGIFPQIGHKLNIYRRKAYTRHLLSKKRLFSGENGILAEL